MKEDINNLEEFLKNDLEKWDRMNEKMEKSTESLKEISKDVESILKSQQETKVSHLLPEDILVLVNATNAKQLANEQAKNADLNYRYVVLQIYRKYGLNDQDTIDLSGNITHKE